MKQYPWKDLFLPSSLATTKQMWRINYSNKTGIEPTATPKDQNVSQRGKLFGNVT